MQWSRRYPPYEWAPPQGCKQTLRHRYLSGYHLSSYSVEEKGKAPGSHVKMKRFSSEPWTGLGFLSCVCYLLPFWSRANNLILLTLSMAPGIRALLICRDCCEIVYVKSIFHQSRAFQKQTIPPKAEASSLLLDRWQSFVQQAPGETLAMPCRLFKGLISPSDGHLSLVQGTGQSVWIAKWHWYQPNTSKEMPTKGRALKPHPMALVPTGIWVCTQDMHISSNSRIVWGLGIEAFW